MVIPYANIIVSILILICGSNGIGALKEEKFDEVHDGEAIIKDSFSTVANKEATPGNPPNPHEERSKIAKRDVSNEDYFPPGLIYDDQYQDSIRGTLGKRKGGQSYVPSLKWAGLGKRGLNWAHKRANTPFKWTGLGKRAYGPDSTEESSFQPSRSKLQSRSASALKWMGLGKRARQTSSLKWVGLGKRLIVDRARRAPPPSPSTAFKWAGLGKRANEQSYDDGDPRLLVMYEIKRAPSSPYRWTGLGKRGTYEDTNDNDNDNDDDDDVYFDYYPALNVKKINGITHIPTGGAGKAWYNAYMNENPLSKVMATKKLNPIYQWSGLGKKKK